MAAFAVGDPVRVVHPDGVTLSGVGTVESVMRRDATDHTIYVIHWETDERDAAPVMFFEDQLRAENGKT